MANKLGVVWMSATTVDHDTRAVRNFRTPASRYAGHQKMIASIKCVNPQARMKAVNRMNRPRKGRCFLRMTKKARTMGIEV